MRCRVRVKRGQLEYFKRQARKTNNEVQAYLIGKVVSEDLVVIDSFAYTSNYATQTPSEVCWYKAEYDEVKKSAEERGLTIVGDIHSHPNYWPVLSPDDHKNCIKECHRLCGVYAIMGKKGKVCFWVSDSSLPAKVEYAEARV